jgi:hypothetical protein
VTDTNVFQLSQPGTFADPLTEILCDGARALPPQGIRFCSAILPPYVSRSKSLEVLIPFLYLKRVCVQARLENDAQCLLVIIGATPEGKKELVGLIDGVRESAQSWKELLLDLTRRGLAIGPELAIADGGLGFWQAIEEVWSKTRGQRCWVHKTADEAAEEPAIESQACAAGDQNGRDQEGCFCGIRRLRRDLGR